MIHDTLHITIKYKYFTGYNIIPNMTNDDWGNVRIPKSVIDEINKKIHSDPKFKKMGFKTYSGFVNYIVMRELDRYSKEL